jgi:Tol biopolymer transport system component/DNA-binding winged helix-turn-helix (wHTH) protein
MATSNSFPSCARFDQFHVDLRSGVLQRAGIRVPVQSQPLQVLRLLLQAEGRVVTREELRKVLWPEDTFVDFELGVNTAVKKLRQALADPAEHPKFVETFPRIGYRFIFPVEWVPDEGEKGTAYVRPADAPNSLASFSATRKWRLKSPAAAKSLIALGVVLLVLICSIGIWWHSRKSSDSPPELTIVPLVALPGGQEEPAFSPDGNQVAFVHIGEANAAGIYTTLVDGGNLLRITDNPGDFGPAWSPDSRQIAFGRRSKDTLGRKSLDIYVVPALGGTPRKLYATTTDEWEYDYLGWSLDGKMLAFTDSTPDGSRSWISLLSLSDFTARPLTSPQENRIDCDPVFSPDGSTILFNRRVGWERDLFLIRAAGGNPRQITFDNRQIVGYTWTKDGRDIVFSSNRGGLASLWRVSASGGTPRPVQGVGAPAYRPSIPPKGDQLVYTQFFSSDNIWRLDLKEESAGIHKAPVRVTATTRGLNRRPNFSPDGKKIVLDSDRLGYSDIYSCDSDGSNCAQVTSFQRETGTARWSPDGHFITFESQAQGHEDIYVVEVPGGTPRLIRTFPGANNGTPNWSRDGQWIYFYSDHQGGPFQLWKVPFKGGAPVPVTKNGGVYGIESADGHFLYYSKFTQPGIWKMPVNGGDESLVLDRPAGDHWYNWALTREGIYFVDDDPPNGKINFLEFATHKTITIFALDKAAPLYGGLAISPDGKVLLFSQEDFWDLHIMLVRNFR